MEVGRFQVGAGAVIQLKGTNQVLLIYRAPTTYSGNIWEIPFGRLEQFESFEDGLRREILEETGIAEIQILQPINTFTFMRGEHSPENEVKGIVFAAETTQQEVKLSHEHTDYKWLPIDEAIELVSHSGVKKDLEIFRSLKATS